MFTNVRYVFITALRDWLFWAMLFGIIAASLIAHMLGATAQDNARAMTITYSSDAARAMIVTGLIIFACFHLHNAFTSREIDVFLSRPITRASLVISYWIGFAFVAFLHTLAVVILTGIQGVESWHGFVFWSLSLLLECWMVVAIALFASFTLRSAVASVLASMGFYVLARMMGYFIATSQTAFVFRQQWLNAILLYMLKGSSIFIPRLDFFAKSDWLVSGFHKAQDLELFAVQAAVFVPLLILATIADFRRKEF